MGDKPQNPLAFPRPGFDNPAGYEDGMTLRDYFAGQVVPITWQQANVMANIGQMDDDRVPGVTARMAYMVADAMLPERLK